MARARVNFFSSLLGKMLIAGIFPMVLLVGWISIYTTNELYVEMRNNAEQSVQDHAKNIALDIDRANRHSVDVVTTMSTAQESGLFGKRIETKAYAKSVLEHNPEFSGAFFGYEPNADGADAAWDAQNHYEYSFSSSLDHDHIAGRFLPYWFRDVNDTKKIQLKPLVNMDKGLYYEGLRRLYEKNGTPTPLITEPYSYEGRFMVETVFPIVINGKFAGVAGVDRSLKNLDTLLNVYQDEKTDIVLFSRQGRVLVDSRNPENRSRKLNPAGAADDVVGASSEPMTSSILPTLKTAFAAGSISGFTEAASPADNQTYYVASEPVLDGNWVLVVSVSKDKLLQPIHSRIMYIAGNATLVLFVMTFLLLWIADSFARRIRVAIEAADRVAEGDLSKEVKADGSDEAGRLLAALHIMTQNLNSLIGQVKHSSLELTSTATELSASSRAQESSINSFGASTNQIAAAITEISATGAELTSTMNEVSAVASSTAKLADSGRDSLTGMSSTMNNLNHSTASISSKLSIISEKASDINLVVTTITKVADQTNLLSINAAIEAEKAGEYGQGFLVVAREIRRLADATGVATLDIEEMVRQMQTAVSAGVMEMDKFTEQVRKGVEEVGIVSARLSEIISQVETITVRFHTVNEGMQSQTQGAEQINGAMIHLTTGAKQTIESLREFGQAADSLHKAIDLLKIEVSNFKLKESK